MNQNTFYVSAMCRIIAMAHAWPSWPCVAVLQWHVYGLPGCMLPYCMAHAWSTWPYSAIL
jgi:hypothetical protein